MTLLQQKSAPHQFSDLNKCEDLPMCRFLRERERERASAPHYMTAHGQPNTTTPHFCFDHAEIRQLTSWSQLYVRQTDPAAGFHGNRTNGIDGLNIARSNPVTFLRWFAFRGENRGARSVLQLVQVSHVSLRVNPLRAAHLPTGSENLKRAITSQRPDRVYRRIRVQCVWSQRSKYVECTNAPYW